MIHQDLVKFTPRGLYCPKGRFYIDPWKPVDKAIITHAHSDHAYWGHRHYLAHHDTLPLLRYKLDRPGIHFYGVEYGEIKNINDVKVSLHPAGHIVGSSQIRLEANGEVWVVSGDYKLENDGLSTPFETLRCHTFITESTFGLPCFQWEPQQAVFEEMNAWWRLNQEQGLTSILLGYSLGKCQRLLMGLNDSIGPLYAHGAVWNITEIIRQQKKIAFPQLQKINLDLPKQAFQGGLVLAPPSAAQSPWMNRFYPYRVGYASGWMSLRGIRRRRGADRGFVLSDHADWPALMQAIQATGAHRIIVTHGFTSPFTRWLKDKGYEAEEALTVYGEEESE